MKKIAGLAAIGIVGIHSAHAQMASMDHSKPWSVSAALRGFYDDNYATGPNVADPLTGVNRKQSSFGYEIVPSASLNLQMEQTTINLGYIYSYRYYEDRPKNKNDQSHSLNAKLDHAFSPRYKMSVSDSFVSAQEPLLIEPTGILSSPLRSNGDNIRNTAKASFTAGVTEELELVPSYEHTFYDYSDKDQIPGGVSRKALLNRTEQTFKLDARYLILPQTTGILGYSYGMTDYDKNGIITATPLYRSDSRNQTNHRIYAGVDQTFNPQLSASLRAGARISEFTHHDRFPGAKSSKTSPYVDASLTYTYAPGSILQAGVRWDQNATDVAALTTGSPVLDAESMSLYASISHKLTAKLTATGQVQYQHSKYDGTSGSGGPTDDFYTANVGLDYQINRWLSTEVNYTYDKLDSESDVSAFRSYDRNRVFIGIRATY